MQISIFALAGYKKILEQRTTNNLALTYSTNEKTIEYYKILIDLEEEQLGPIAHNTLLSKNNLGLNFLIMCTKFYLNKQQKD